MPVCVWLLFVRSICRSVGRSVGWLVVCSFGQSVGRLVEYGWLLFFSFCFLLFLTCCSRKRHWSVFYYYTGFKIWRKKIYIYYTQIYLCTYFNWCRELYTILLTANFCEIRRIQTIRKAGTNTTKVTPSWPGVSYVCKSPTKIFISTDIVHFNYVLSRAGTIYSN